MIASSGKTFGIGCNSQWFIKLCMANDAKWGHGKSSCGGPFGFADVPFSPSSISESAQSSFFTSYKYLIIIYN